VISELAQQIDHLLPQTQCTKCGFDGCAPYAGAIADGTALYNQCPPGGQAGVARLAQLLQRVTLPLNPANGAERPRPRAVIDESLCIGCTLCIQACPVDAIVGAAKQMHTVIEAVCTGCDLCVAPCPVDCIEMVPVTGDATGWDAWSQQQADDARARYQQRLARQAAERQAAAHRAALRVAEHAAQLQRAESVAAGSATTPNADAKHRGGDASSGTLVDASAPGTAPATAETSAQDAAQARKQAIIQAAIARARLRQQANASVEPSSTPRDGGSSTAPGSSPAPGLSTAPRSSTASGSSDASGSSAASEPPTASGSSGTTVNPVARPLKRP